MVEEFKEEKFIKARNKFLEIKSKIESSEFEPNKEEFIKALDRLVSSYDTRNRENRFVVGSALELLFCVFLNSLHFKTKWISEETRYDIEIDSIRFSLKSSFTSSGSIRLINILGNKKAVWNEPTIFFISDLGICYVDPNMGFKTKHTSDALTIQIRDIKKFVEKDKKWLIEIDIPHKPNKKEKIKTASYDVVKSILDEIGSKYLKNYFYKISK